MKIAYLVSEYPAISHTFILNEIFFLRKLHKDAANFSYTILTTSIRRPQNIKKMGKEEQSEYSFTYYIREKIWQRGFLSLFTLAVKDPKKFIRLLYNSLTWCVFQGPKNPLKACGYMLQAVILRDFCQTTNTKHIHVHFANPAATVAMLTSSISDISFSISAHGPDIFYDSNENLLQIKAENALFIRCISHYCVSQFMRLLPSHDWKKLHIVRCGIDVDRFQNRLDAEKVHNEMQNNNRKNNNTIHFLCIGRLCVAKSQALLLQAFLELHPILEAQGIKAHLTFAGGFHDGSDALHKEIASYIYGYKSSMQYIKKFSNALQREIISFQSVVQGNTIQNIDTEIHFTGPVSHAKVRELYKEADIFVLPSVAEGVPMVLMEAMAMQVPCIASQITGIGELIEHEKSGLLFFAGDTISLKESMLRLALDDTLRKKLAENGREKVINHYSIKNTIRSLDALYRSFIDK